MTQLNVSKWNGLTVKQAVLLRKQQLADFALKLEQGGFTWNGYAIPTTDRLQNKITASDALAQKDATTTVRLPLLNGTWQQFDATQIQAMATAVGQFVVACNNNEAALSDQIDAAAAKTSATVADIKAVDITTGWPLNHN